jgi:hypothetical protein
MINAAIIGSGIGLKHLEAINGYKNSKVIIICENNLKKIKKLKSKFKNIEITNDENEIFKNKKINLVSIASYDDDHFSQIKKCIKYKKHIIVEKPMCLNSNQLEYIRGLLINKKPLYVNTFGNDIITKNSKFKKKSFIIYIFEFSNNIIVKITANAVGIYKHFHEIKVFEKKKTLVNSYMGAYMFNSKKKKK